MSTRSNLGPQAVIGGNSGVSGTMTADITSKITILKSLTVGSYSYSWTGTSPVGTIALQGSNDYSLNPDGTVNNAGTWTAFSLDLNGSLVSSIPISGNSGNGIIEWTTGVYALRTFYDFTSGTGTLQCIVNGKVS